MGEFKVGDLVRAQVARGTVIKRDDVGKVEMLGSDFVHARWPCGTLEWLYLDEVTLHSPAPEQPGACSACLGTLNSVCPHKQLAQVVASVRVCGAECAEHAARHRELKSELLEAQDHIAALGEERGVLLNLIGDTKGDRDHWQRRAEKAEALLDLAMKRSKR